MANFRGLIEVLFRGRPEWAAAVIMGLSALALGRTIIHWRSVENLPEQAGAGSTCDFAFANTVLCALLVSYHMNPHDLSLLLLPMTLLAQSMGNIRCWRAAQWVVGFLLGILFFPPLHVWALRAGVYFLLGVPLIVLMFWPAGSFSGGDAARQS